MIPKGEKKISLEEAATVIRREYGGKRKHVLTISRWCLHGRRGVVLESLKVGGGGRVTSEEAIERFFQRCAEPRAAIVPQVLVPSMESLDAERQLIAQGV